MALRTLQKHARQTEQWIGNVPLFDLLNDFGKCALFGEEIDLYRSWFGLGTKALFFPAWKARPVVPERLWTASFGTTLGWRLRSLVVGG
jgi:hypothetical protein